MGNDDYDNLPITEAELRERARKRVEEREEERSGFLYHLIIFLGVNLLVFGLGNWLLEVFRGQATELPGTLWITFFWGMGLVAHGVEYWNEHGPGRESREREIEREIERERERIYSLTEKPKNDFRSGVRIGEDGELIEVTDDEKRQRR
ncbi:MAG: 2TM domain-containing protein [bacterium]|nr:2TM domain-containing protein [bacterium]